MARQVVSRSQRRMEKKQAMVLLVLVLAVSLVSFTLGVMVGRGGSKASVAATPAPAPARQPVAKEQPKEQLAAAEAAPKGARESLTFYDSLPKGEQPPLGSGINRPPEDKGAKKGPAKSPESSQKSSAEASPAKIAPLPNVAANGAYVVQVASFRGSGDALKLKERLAKKDYMAFVEEADLKQKGTWHRVFVGPYENSAAAGKVVERLKVEEKLTTLVKKR